MRRQEKHSQRAPCRLAGEMLQQFREQRLANKHYWASLPNIARLRCSSSARDCGVCKSVDRYA
eukprot:5469126-Pyramimonas_sp.AAC.1